MLICRLSSLSTPSGPTSSFWILLALPPPSIQSPCALWITAHCSLLFIIENILKTGPTSLSLSFSLSLLSSLMNLLRVCRLSEGTLHISLHHTLLRSAPFKVLLLSSLLSSHPFPSPLSHAALPTCVQPVPRGAPPPSLKINFGLFMEASRQAGRHELDIFDRERKKKLLS